MSEEDLNLVRVQRILDKLEQVRAGNFPRHRLSNHNFLLNPPITEADLQAFEARHHIQLPPDYRAFLQYAGNGGTGPYGDFFPLDRWNDFADWVLDEYPDNFLALACPLYPGLPQTHDWAGRFHSFSPYQGTLPLGSRGCAFATQLIVSGPFAGRVVYVDAESYYPPYILHEPDFLSWYERWLDERLQGYKSGSSYGPNGGEEDFLRIPNDWQKPNNTVKYDFVWPFHRRPRLSEGYRINWFGYGPGGGEDDFFHILNDPKSDDNFKAEAAWAFRRLPRLSQHAARRIPHYLTHSIAGVRSGALATIRKFELSNTIEEAARLLDDLSPDVREQAVRTVLQFDPQRWAGPVLRLLWEDVDENVTTITFSELRAVGALPKPELLHLIQQSPLSNLRGLAAYCVAWTNEDIPLLIRMLSDSELHVRLYATRALGQLQAKESLPHLLALLSQETYPELVHAILKILGDFAEPSTASVLLKWAESDDDFHRLDAIAALAKIGDERTIPIAQAMLREERKPVRQSPNGGFLSNGHTITTLVQQSLKESPNPALRKLAN